MAVLMWAVMMFIYAILAVGSTSLLEIPILFIMGFTIFLVCCGAVYGYFIMGMRTQPGIYEHGVELLGHGFVPYEEIESTSRRSPMLGRTLKIQLRGPGNTYELARTVYGLDGTRYLEARVKGPGVRKGGPPKLVVYPQTEQERDSDGMRE
jgi:hypothetical protein